MAAYPAQQRRAIWAVVSIGLVGLACILQGVAFCTPGWFRLNITCGETGLVYMQVPKGLLESNFDKLKKGCDVKPIPELFWKDDEPYYERLEKQYSYADDIINCLLPIGFTGLVVLLDIVALCSSGKRTMFISLALQLIGIAAVLQWGLVFKYIRQNIVKYNGNGISAFSPDLLFPYSLFLFAFGSFLNLITGVIHVVAYIERMPMDNRKYNLS